MSTSRDKLHLILFFFLILFIIVALAIESVSYMEDTWNFLVDLLSCNSFVLFILASFILSLLLIHIRYSLY